LAVTIKDVARHAQVSIASVSRVLNRKGVVSEPTRQRVLHAAQHLRYTPHEAARSLITRRTRTVGVLLPDMHGEYFSELIRGIDRAARLSGLQLLVSSSHGDEKEAALALRSMYGRVDGVLIMSPYVDAKVLVEPLPSSLPVVLLNTQDTGGCAASIMIDDFGGAEAMVKHLLAQGRKRIAHITGPDNNYESNERMRGYRAALGRIPICEPTVYAGTFTEESGYIAGQQIAVANPRPDAVFASNDMMAIGCLLALTEVGIRVPADIALAGFDDIPIARFVSPPLTTVRAQTAELGRRSLETLVRAIEAPDSERRNSAKLATQLVIRASCGNTESTVAAKPEPGRRI
jgi:LacI family transcriptional regulator